MNNFTNSERAVESGTENSKKVIDALSKNSEGTTISPAKDLTATGGSPFYAGVGKEKGEKEKKIV